MLLRDRNKMVETLMDRIDKILNHDLFLYHLERNNAAEADRRFCRHSMVHFLLDITDAGECC